MRATIQAECDHFAGRDADDPFLFQLLAGVNKRFFHNKIQAEVIWQVPRGTVSLFVGEPGIQIEPGDPLFNQLQQARSCLQQGNLSAALQPLTACADANHPESKLLLCHIYKRQGDERWQRYAREYNRHCATVRAVPAACYYADRSLIAIHPHLQELGAPQFVLKYLLYHECCHQLVPSSDQEPHSAAFLHWEYQAPNRDRALHWLERQGFPTLRTSHGP
ncbi:MAG: hypothetical protein SV765_10740 [Pseudomonadota bacterium]|nr:hypothetical protein [Pseudomonadales bacterium]MDY6920673.1 hypothetical protein [Pseudomonadota bacterium]